ncbi:MAG: UDP-glucose dehydrogenase family protein [bacterium]
MKVSVIGTGYVGLVTATCLAYLGHDVACLDIDEKKIENLKEGKIPIYEPNLEQLLEDTKKTDKFPIFTTDPKIAMEHGEIIFIAVGTPPKENGEPDLRYIEACAKTIGKHAKQDCIVINKSTVPVGSGNWVYMLIEQANPKLNFHVASNPEFLREGSAIFDTFYADRIVIGTEGTARNKNAEIGVCEQSLDENFARAKLKELYKPLIEQSFTPPSYCPRPNGQAHIPFISTDITSAEMIKYSANSFLAMKISFANQIANICDLVGADVTEVMHGIGTDSRIGSKFLNAGIGWGGSCFGKDVQALIKIAEEYDYNPELLYGTTSVNYKQRNLVIKRLQDQMKILKGRKIGLLGLAFKPNTDDLRDAPALDIAKALIKLGASVSVTDPIAAENCKKQNPDLEVNYVNDPYELAQGKDALILVTEWDEYRKLDLEKVFSSMAGPKILLDGRNIYSPADAREIGFNYISIGR